MALSDKEMLFVAYLLAQGSDAIFSRISEDMHPDVFELFSPKEKDEMTRAYHEWNGDPESYEPGNWWPQGSVWSLWMSKKIMDYLTDKYKVGPGELKIAVIEA